MTLRKQAPAIAFLIIAILAALYPQHFTLDYVQAGENYPFACVADATDLRLYRWRHYHDGIKLETSQWDELQSLSGNSIWLGYDGGGWDVPDDVKGQWKIIGTMDGEPVEIWLWANTDTDRYYVLSFDNTGLYGYGDNNEHYGMHPCGNGAVSKFAILNIVARIQDNVSFWNEGQ